MCNEIIDWPTFRLAKKCTLKHEVFIEAAIQGDIAVMKLLLNSGVCVNATKIDGTTALHAAAAEGELDIIRLLLIKGANVNAKNAFGTTALHSAADACHLDAMQMLVDSGADVRAKDNNGKSPLHLAIERNLIVIDVFEKSTF